MTLRRTDVPSPGLASLCNEALAAKIAEPEPSKSPPKYPCPACDGTGLANEPMVVSFVAGGRELAKTVYPECMPCWGTGRERVTYLGMRGEPKGGMDRERWEEASD